MRNQKSALFEFVQLAAGSALVALGVYFFKFPNHFSFGGVTGLAAVASTWLPVSPADFSFLANMALLAVGFAFLGKSFGLKTAYASLLNSLLLSLLSLAFLAYSLFRCYSRNIGARATENARFESWLRKPRAALARLRGRWAGRKDVKYLKCPQCGQSLSVPRGKGTLRVTCPKCHAQTTVKS